MTPWPIKGQGTTMGRLGQNGSNSHPKAGLSWPSLPRPGQARLWMGIGAILAFAYP